jgi:hypothetical protein
MDGTLKLPYCTYSTPPELLHALSCTIHPSPNDCPSYYTCSLGRRLKKQDRNRTKSKELLVSHVALPDISPIDFSQFSRTRHSHELQARSAVV